MLEYLLNYMAPISSVRRNLIIVLGLGLLVAFFTVDTSDFQFLGVRFDPDTLVFIISFLCIFYSSAMAFKSLIVFRIYSKDRSRMINDVKALLVQERNEYVKRDVDILDKISNVDIDYTKSPKVMSAMHSLRTLQADSIWGYAAILFEYALPVALGFILGVYLALQLF